MKHSDSERYFGHLSTKTVHDLQNEKQNCKIAELTLSGGVIPFRFLEVANELGYENCKNCLCEES